MTSYPELVSAGQKGSSASLLQNPGTNSRAAQPTQNTAPRPPDWSRERGKEDERREGEGKEEESKPSRRGVNGEEKKKSWRHRISKMDEMKRNIKVQEKEREKRHR